MIDFENVGKAFRRKNGEYMWVFRHLNAQFKANTNVGILAAHGSGKTTLINLIAGNETPSEGRLIKRAMFSWPYSFRNNITAKLTGRQNLRFLTEVYGRNFDTVLDFVCDFAELGRIVDTSLRRWTPDQRIRLSVASLLAMGFDCVLIDDDIPTRDGSFRRRVLQFLEDNRDEICLIIATSDTAFVSRYCDVGVILDRRGLTIAPTVGAAVEQYNETVKAFA